MIAPVLSKQRSRQIGALIIAAMVLAVAGPLVLKARDTGSATVVRPGSLYFAEGDRPAPELVSAELVTADGTTGERYDFAAARGRVTVVNFWASWCTPCYREAPVLAQMADEFAPQGVDFVGVAVKDERSRSAAFLAQHGLDYPNVFDGDGRVQLAFSRVARLGSLPVTVVLDADGRVGGVVYGEVRYTDLAALVDRVTGRAAAPTVA